MKFLIIIICFLALACTSQKTNIPIIEESQMVINEEGDTVRTNCDEIKRLLELRNWRKHATENCYVIDNSSIHRFAFELGKKRCVINSTEEMRALFGNESYVQNPYSQNPDTLITRYYIYDIAIKDSLSLEKQEYLSIYLKEKNNKIFIVKGGTISDIPIID